MAWPNESRQEWLRKILYLDPASEALTAATGTRYRRLRDRGSTSSVSLCLGEFVPEVRSCTCEDDGGVDGRRFQPFLVLRNLGARSS
jgi:hypothetical protein